MPRKRAASQRVSEVTKAAGGKRAKASTTLTQEGAEPASDLAMILAEIQRMGERQEAFQTRVEAAILSLQQENAGLRERAPPQPASPTVPQPSISAIPPGIDGTAHPLSLGHEPSRPSTSANSLIHDFPGVSGWPVLSGMRSMDVTGDGSGGGLRLTVGGRAITQQDGAEVEVQKAEASPRNPVQLCMQTTVTADMFQDNSDAAIHSDTSRFVKTNHFDDAVDILEDGKCVIISGPPGSGKTALAHALLRRFEQEGCTPYVLTSVAEARLHTGAGGQRCVLLLDGTLGEVRVDPEQHRQWRAALCSLTQRCSSGTCLLVLTAYPHVLRQLRAMDRGTDSPFSLPDAQVHVCLSRGGRSEAVKRRILDVHLRELDLEADRREALIDKVLRICVDFVRYISTIKGGGIEWRWSSEHDYDADTADAVFPWCCRQMVKQWQSLKNPLIVFFYPAHAYLPLLQRMVADPEHGRAFTAVLSLVMSGQSQFLNQPLESQPLLSKLGLGDLSDFQLVDYAHCLRGSLLTEEGDGFYSRLHYDAAGLALGSEVTLPILLKVCDVRFLIKYVRIRQCSTEFTVNLGTNPITECVQMLKYRFGWIVYLLIAFLFYLCIFEIMKDYQNRNW